MSIWKKRVCITILCLVSLFISVYSVSGEDNELLSEGLNLFRQGLYKQAIINFRDILLNPDFQNFHGDSYFWISKAYMVLGKLTEAEKNLEYYLATYKDHSAYSEALYQKGRLLFMQGEYENSIQILSGYVETYPNSIFLSNAFFWVGESLYLLGHLEEALVIFKNIIQNYTSSYKYEAAKYRMSIIEFKKRENELLKLLKWSHMESLKSLEDFQHKERTYEQAITSYQKRLASTGQDESAELLAEKERELLKLQETNSRLITKISDLESQINLLKAESAALKNLPIDTTATTTTTDSGSAETGTTEPGQLKNRFLDAKSDALALKEELLKLLEASIGGQ